MKSYALINATIINEGIEEKKDVLIEGERITRILPSGTSFSDFPKDVELIDLGGKFLLPGVIDDHVHFRQPGLEEKADIHTESIAAAAGGVTSFMDMPNTKPPTLTRSLLEEKFAAAAKSSVINYSFYIGCSQDNLNEVLSIDPKNVCGIKLFMGSSTGDLKLTDPTYLRSLFEKAPTLIAAHCEDEEVMKEEWADGLDKICGEDNIPFAMHALIRSEHACFSSSEKAVQLARETGAHLHILHISTARELSLLDKDMPIEEKHITGEITPSHLWFVSRDYDRLSGKVKANPSLKTEEDRRLLRLAFKQGLLDVVGSDHAPHTLKEKQKRYWDCPSGMPIVQHSLPLIIELALEGEFPLTRVVEMMCHNPARLFRIKERGFIREGYFADLTVVDTRRVWEVKTDNILYKCAWSPLEGTKFRARVEYTFVNGRPVFNRGLIDEKSTGHRLIFNR